MKIGHLVSFNTTYPLKKHNGRYDWVLRLASLQAQAGLQPVIYSNPASFIDIPGIEWRSIPERLENTTETNLELLKRAMHDDDIDIFHSHLDSLHYRAARYTDKPIVFTQHWFPTPEIARAAQNAQPNVWAVPVTQYMAAADRELGIRAVDPIYHGIDLSLFAFSDAPRSERLLFVGRIAPHKGVAEAIDIALQAGVGLDIIGKLNDKDRPYWDTFAGKIDGETIRYLGPKPQAEVAYLMNQALGMIFLPQHLEAFGQTIIEAQACGTPVILNNVGANSELVQNGKTGFVIDSSTEALEAVKELQRIDRQACRHFAKQFNQQTMLDAYTALYTKLVG